MACWWQKLAFPLKRAFGSAAARVKSSKQGPEHVGINQEVPGGGLTKLHKDVQTCGYEDVKVMWELLRRPKTEFETSSLKKRKRPFRRVLFIFSSHHHPAEFTRLGLA